MSKEYILIIAEGEKLEKQIVNNIKKHYFKKGKKEIFFLPFKTDIYELYLKLKEDDFETNIVDILLELNNSETEIKENKDNISQTYLFFDYDGQAQSNNKKYSDYTITEMLSYFQDETEEGKLYISYPMAEAIKDFKNLKDKHLCSDNCVVAAKNNIRYKEKVDKISAYSNINSLDRKFWTAVCCHTLKKTNCLLIDEYKFPSDYEIYLDLFSQCKIFNLQLSKYIKKNKIMVLSGFPLFLIDYFGKKFFNEIIWKIAFLEEKIVYHCNKNDSLT